MITSNLATLLPSSLPSSFLQKYYPVETFPFFPLSQTDPLGQSLNVSRHLYSLTFLYLHAAVLLLTAQVFLSSIQQLVAQDDGIHLGRITDPLRLGGPFLPPFP